MAQNQDCTYKEGPLPSCAPLAVATIPMQPAAKPAFDTKEALVKGTLFPGLDLPFMDYVAVGPVDDTPMAELMALDFVTHELALYLDTHPGDTEAFETWKAFSELAAEGRRRYTERCRPITQDETALRDSWVWTKDPWPWDKCAKGGKD